jgi:hypothetical protein
LRAATERRLLNESPQISQSGDPPQFAARDEPPSQYHQTAIGNGSIGLYHRIAINGVLLQPDESRRGGHDQYSAFVRDEIDCVLNSSVKEAKSENLNGLWHARRVCKTERGATSSELGAGS